MNRKIVLAAAVLCLLAAVLCFAAGAKKDGSDAAVGGKVQVTDSTGRQVEVPAHPERVVILNASNVDLYVAAGGGSSIVGKASSQAYSPAVQEATAGASEVGIIHSPSLETIVSLKPDLVIGTNVPFHQGLIPTLEKAGIPLYINELNSFEDIYNTLELFGRWTGKEEVAGERIKALQAERQELTEAVSGRTPPRSLVIFGSPDSFSMATGRTFAGSLIGQLGGGNIADTLENDSAYIPLSMEYLAKENPEVIFIIMMGNPQQMEEKIHKDLEASPAWAETSAVKNGRVHILPYNLFTVNPGVQAADAMKLLYKYMYENE
ncbi:ABC transporter substrate-binding protein [Anaerovibrio sp.]|uniref:ABC transporter substrate-binding protein n=1 Tax=Anaerovibrio sp. TaxID=1872532 RepID=UPI003F148DC3